LSKFVNIKILQKIISKLTQKQKLIFFSSYAVKSKFLRKDPLYIRHKKLGELLIKKKIKNYFIIRPAKIVESFQPLLSKSRIKRFKFYNDRYIHVTSYKLIIDVVEKILIKDLTGILNLVSLDKISFVNRNADYVVIIGNKAHWKKGVAFMASQAIIKHGFNKLNLKRIWCATASSNIPMQALAKRLGMMQEGCRRSHFYFDGKWDDMVEFGILKDECSFLRLS
jgi:RimJ/RimL family protein N-acetyltransferase